MNQIEKRFLNLKKELSSNGKFISANILLQRAATLWPKRIALICNDETITYEKLYQETIFLSKKLQEQGIKKGDRILIMYENSINFYKAYYAAWQTGAIVAPLNVFLHQHELEHIISDSKPALIIASEKQKEKLTEIKQIEFSIASEEFFKDIKTSQEKFSIPEQDENSCTVLLYTSGTTGLPKGVMISSKMIITNCLQGIANFDMSEHERVFATLPLFHSYMQNAAVWSTFLVGATVIIVPSINRTLLLQGLAHNPTVVLGVPQLFGLFALLKTAPFPQVKLFISGGDPLQNKIRMVFELVYNRKLVNGYGLTETGPFVAVDLDDARYPNGCVGRAMPGLEIQVRDEQGARLPACQPGVLWVEGDNIMLGYYNAPQPTANIMKLGWLNTGDMAYFTSDGLIVLCGRERDLISNKGLKIYPPEVENIITGHPTVTMAAVVGMVHDGVEVPVAFVVSKEPEAKLIPELQKLCKNNLAPFKIPVHFYVRTELPLTATGKIDKKILRKELTESET